MSKIDDLIQKLIDTPLNFNLRTAAKAGSDQRRVVAIGNPPLTDDVRKVIFDYLTQCGIAWDADMDDYDLLMALDLAREAHREWLDEIAADEEGIPQEMEAERRADLETRYDED